jgi:hypothetical protein
MCIFNGGGGEEGKERVAQTGSEVIKSSICPQKGSYLQESDLRIKEQTAMAYTRRFKSKITDRDSGTALIKPYSFLLCTRCCQPYLAGRQSQSPSSLQVTRLNKTTERLGPELNSPDPF